jgi:hypothetical protein
MTASEAVAFVDKMKPNRFSPEEKYRWLTDIDGMIVRELIDAHEDSPLTGEFKGYIYGKDDDVELIVPAPYDSLYRWYLESQIDLGNMEIGKYNNTKNLFNQQYLAYTDHYNRTHMPKNKGGFKFTERRRGGEQDALSSRPY